MTRPSQVSLLTGLPSTRTVSSTILSPLTSPLCGSVDFAVGAVVLRVFDFVGLDLLLGDFPISIRLASEPPTSAANKTVSAKTNGANADCCPNHEIFGEGAGILGNDLGAIGCGVNDITDAVNNVV